MFTVSQTQPSMNKTSQEKIINELLPFSGCVCLSLSFSLVMKRGIFLVVALNLWKDFISCVITELENFKIWHGTTNN